MHTAEPTTQQRLLDAATEAVRGGLSWDRLRMADVARQAGVSRQTLYYEFGSRDALAQAVALREAQRYSDGASAAIAAAGQSSRIVSPRKRSADPNAPRGSISTGA